YGNKIVRLKDLALLQYLLPYLRRCKAARCRIEMLQPAADLGRLKSNAPNAGLLQGIFYYGADLIVIEPLLEGDYQRGRKIVCIEIFKRFLPDIRQVLAAQL